MNEIFIYIIAGLSVINLIILIAIGAFLVQMRQRVNRMFSDLLDLLENFDYVPMPSVETKENKTWDQKWEEELDAARRMRSIGLQDLPDPGLSWGSPPAPNAQNSEGLIIKDK